jgi:hypothetical protein
VGVPKAFVSSEPETRAPDHDVDQLMASLVESLASPRDQAPAVPAAPAEQSDSRPSPGHFRRRTIKPEVMFCLAAIVLGLVVGVLVPHLLS